MFYISVFQLFLIHCIHGDGSASSSKLAGILGHIQNICFFLNIHTSWLLVIQKW